MIFSEKLLSLSREAEKKLEPYFKNIDEMSFYHTSRVLEAFSEFRLSDAMVAGTSGYGYDDKGRDTLDAIYARVFDAEAALVRHNIVNGTQALTIGLFGLLRPGDIMLSVTGKPYDTLDEVIASREGNGSLADFGVEYRQIELGADG